MGIFDNWNSGQASNGTGPPNPQQAVGAPGYDPGSWGNIPQNFASRLQSFMGSVGIPGIGAQLKAGPKPVTPPIAPGPAMGVGTPTGAAPGAFGSGTAVPTQGPAGAPGVVSSMAPNTNSMAAPDAATPGGMNFANTMRPYLGG